MTEPLTFTDRLLMDESGATAIEYGLRVLVREIFHLQDRG